MSKKCETEVSVDTTNAEVELAQLEAHIDMVEKSVMDIIRKSYSSAVLLADILGVVIPEWFNLMATGAIMAAEMMVTLAHAETVTGLLAAKAFITFSMASILFTRGMFLNQQKTVVEQKLNSTIQLLNMWS